MDIYTAQARLPEATPYWQIVKGKIETVRLYFSAILTMLHVSRRNIDVALDKFSPEILFPGFGRAYYLLGWLYYVKSQPEVATLYLNYSIAYRSKMSMEGTLSVAFAYTIMARLKRDAEDFSAR